jgi:hypothetical protein
MNARWLGLTCVSVLAAILTAAVVAISMTRSGDENLGRDSGMPPFTMVYERLRVGSTNGELNPPHRELIELRWFGESSWTRTILYSDAGRFGEQGEWQAANGKTLTSSDDEPDEIDEPNGVWVPEVWWFSRPPLQPRGENERIERLGEYMRWTREHPFECDPGELSLLCHVTRDQPGVNVETVTYDPRGIPVAYVDRVGAVAIEIVTMLSLELE